MPIADQFDENSCCTPSIRYGRLASEATSALRSPLTEADEHGDVYSIYIINDDESGNQHGPTTDDVYLIAEMTRLAVPVLPHSDRPLGGSISNSAGLSDRPSVIFGPFISVRGNDGCDLPVRH